MKITKHESKVVETKINDFKIHNNSMVIDIDRMEHYLDCI